VSEETARIQRLQQEAEELIRKAKEEQGKGDTSVASDAIAATQQEAEEKAEKAEKAKNGSVHESLEEVKKPVDSKFPELEAKKVERKEPRRILPPDPVVENKLPAVALKSVKEKNPAPTIRERIEEQKKREEERMRRMQEEKERIRSLEQAVEDKLSAVRSAVVGDKNTKSDSKDSDETGGVMIKDDAALKKVSEEESKPRKINGVEIIDNKQTAGNSSTSEEAAQLPRWKREKLLRENRSVSRDESIANGGPSSHNSPPSLSSAAARKTSLGPLVVSTSALPAAAASMPSPVLTESDPEFARLPRWKREKILRERRQSQDLLPAPSPQLASSASSTAAPSPQLSEAADSCNGEQGDASPAADAPVAEPLGLAEPGTANGDVDVSPTLPSRRHREMEVHIFAR
jgi:hypothetical protein